MIENDRIEIKYLLFGRFCLMIFLDFCCIYSKVSKNVHIFAKKSAEVRKSVPADSKGEALGRARD